MTLCTAGLAGDAKVGRGGAGGGVVMVVVQLVNG